RLGGRRRRSFREGDTDPGIRWTAVVVADEETADAAERVADGEGRGGSVGGVEEIDLLHQQIGAASEEAADQAAVPNQAGAVEEKVPVAKEDRVVNLRAGDSAKRGGHDDRRCRVIRKSVTAELPRQHPAADDERGEHHQAEGGDLERAEFDERWIHFDSVSHVRIESSPAFWSLMKRNTSTLPAESRCCDTSKSWTDSSVFKPSSSTALRRSDR